MRPGSRDPRRGSGSMPNLPNMAGNARLRGQARASGSEEWRVESARRRGRLVSVSVARPTGEARQPEPAAWRRARRFGPPERDRTDPESDGDGHCTLHAHVTAIDACLLTPT